MLSGRNGWAEIPHSFTLYGYDSSFINPTFLFTHAIKKKGDKKMTVELAPFFHVYIRSMFLWHLGWRRISMDLPVFASLHEHLSWCYDWSCSPGYIVYCKKLYYNIIYYILIYYALLYCIILRDTILYDALPYDNVRYIIYKKI